MPLPVMSVGPPTDAALAALVEQQVGPDEVGPFLAHLVKTGAEILYW